jgi:hypothetical protein
MPKVGSQMSQGYTLANDWIQERDRLRLRESVHDPETISSLNGWELQRAGTASRSGAAAVYRGMALPEGGHHGARRGDGPQHAPPRPP